MNIEKKPAEKSLVVDGNHIRVPQDRYVIILDQNGSVTDILSNVRGYRVEKTAITDDGDDRDERFVFGKGHSPQLKGREAEIQARYAGRFAKWQPFRTDFTFGQLERDGTVHMYHREIESFYFRGNYAFTVEGVLNNDGSLMDFDISIQTEAYDPEMMWIRVGDWLGEIQDLITAHINQYVALRTYTQLETQDGASGSTPTKHIADEADTLDPNAHGDSVDAKKDGRRITLANWIFMDTFLKELLRSSGAKIFNVQVLNPRYNPASKRLQDAMIAGEEQKLLGKGEANRNIAAMEGIKAIKEQATVDGKLDVDLFKQLIELEKTQALSSALRDGDSSVLAAFGLGGAFGNNRGGSNRGNKGGNRKK